MTLQQAWIWLKSYWYIPLALVAAIALILVGKSDIAHKILTSSRRSNDEQQAELKRLEAERKKKQEAAQKAYEDAIAALEEQRKEDSEKLDDKTKAEVKALTEKYKDDPEGMAKEFAEQFGLVLVGKEDE